MRNRFRRFDEFLDANQGLRQATTLDAVYSRRIDSSTFWRITTPEKQNPPRGRVLNRLDDGVDDLSQRHPPKTQAGRQAKTMFSLTGDFVPIFGPSAGWLLLQPPRRTHVRTLPIDAPLANFMPPPARPGRAGGQLQDLYAVACVA
jgi:hypothetical protein